MTNEEMGRLILQASTGSHGNVAKKLADALVAVSQVAVKFPGLGAKVAKFADAEANALATGSTEREHYMIEAALQRGFEIVDDEGDVFLCSSRQIVSLLTPAWDAADKAKSEPPVAAVDITADTQIPQ